MSPKDKLAAGRLMARERMPYFSAALWSMIPHEVPGLGTYGVTKHGVLMWDPEITMKWSVEEVADCLLHEVGHMLRDHATRGEQGGFEHHRFNIAGDAEINDDLKAAGLLKQGKWILPKQLGCEDGKLAEEYYHHIRTMKISVALAGGKGDGSEEGDGDQKPGHGKGTCGSGAGGKPLPGEPDPQMVPGRSEADQARVRRQVASEIQKEAEKGRGNIPGGWARWADAQLQPPTIPWQQKLARYARSAVSEKAGMTDYSYARPSRRQAGMGYGPGNPVLPTMRGHKPQVLVAVDTSGSMGDVELREAMQEVNGIIKAAGGAIDFMSCDTMVHAQGKVLNIADAGKLVKGGGGTDFRPVFEAAERLPRRPSVLIFLTDGMGPAPEVQPTKMAVIWVLIGPYQQRPCPWGELVEVPHAGRKAARR